MTLVLESASLDPIAPSGARAGRELDGDHEAQARNLPCHRSA